MRRTRYTCGCARWDGRIGPCSRGRSVRLAVVDGSCFGGVWASVLGFAGAFYYSVDVERSAGRGHELATSRAMVARATQRLGAGFATHLLYDGLMANRADFATARRHWGLHLVVKTSEQTLALVADSRLLWSAATPEQLQAAGVEVVRGTDEVRAVSYTVCAQGALRWEELVFPLKLAWVRETHLKGKSVGQTFEFWVLTTDESLSAAELRELAHARWAIENNGFKRTNAAVGSKKAYLKDAAAKEALLLLWGDWAGVAGSVSVVAGDAGGVAELGREEDRAAAQPMDSVECDARRSVGVRRQPRSRARAAAPQG